MPAAAQADAPVASTHTPLTPVRVLDTRSRAAVGPGGVVSVNLARSGHGLRQTRQRPGAGDVPCAGADLRSVRATTIGAGGAQAFAVRADGSVWGWGSNSRGGLGNGTDDTSYVPVQVLDITDAVAVTGAQTSGGLALDSTGRVWSWGDNGTGDLGVGSYLPYRNRPGVVPGLTGVDVLGAGGRVVVP